MNFNMNVNDILRKMKALYGLNIAAILIVAGMLFTHPVFAGEPKNTSYADSIQILKISSQDEKAVIKRQDGKTQIIKVGDILQDQGLESQSSRVELTVVEITEGRVVFEEKTGEGTDTVIVRVEGAKQKVERISRSSPRTQPLRAPKIIVGTETMKKEGN